MARIRSVHPDICESTTLAEIDDPAVERTFVRLWTACDDEGRAKADARLLKAKLYPLHDSVTAGHVEDDLQALAAHGSIRLYEVDGVRYLDVPNWGEFQHPNKPTPSKLPAFPSDYVPPTAPLHDADVTPEETPETSRVGVEVGVEVGEGVEPSGTATLSPLPVEIPPRPIDDPIKAQAHALAVLAMEQPVKPDIANSRNGPFPAVMGLLERRLRAGVTVNTLKELVLVGIDVWTTAGVQTAEAKLKASRNGRDVNDTQRRITERHSPRVPMPALGAGS